MIRKYLIDKLKSDTAVAALVGTKVHALVAPQGVALPFVTVQVVEAPADESFQQPGERNRLDVDQATINCWAATVLDAEALHNAVRRCLEVVNKEAYDGETVQMIQFVRASDELEETTETFYMQGVYRVRITRPA